MINKINKSIFSKILTMLLCFVLCFTYIPFLDSKGIVSNADVASTIKLGDYVQMGTYYNQPILWRCVAFYKVDANGNVDLDETSDTYKDGYLPLMLSDKILCLKAFDAKGTETTGSHVRGRTYNGTKGFYRQKYGSNCWEDSNIRCWLNSTKSGGEVNWACGNKPDISNVGKAYDDSGNWRSYNAYDNEAGFLTNFTESETKCMKSVTQYQLLDRYEYDNMSSYGKTYHKHNAYIVGCVKNFDDAYKKEITDTMFLLDIKQAYKVYDNGKNLDWGDYYQGEPTEKCIENSDYKNSKLLKTGEKWYYWLRSPYADYGYSQYVRTISKSNNTGEVFCSSAYTSYNGVRPAFFLDVSRAAFISGNGEAETPYTLVNVPEIVSKTSDRINIGNVIYDEGTAEYAISTTDAAPTDNDAWKESTEFPNLAPDTKYYIFTRNKNNSSLTTKILEVTTKKTGPNEPEITVDWTREQTGIIDSKIEYRKDGGDWTTGSGEKITLLPGTTYTFRIKVDEDTTDPANELAITVPSRPDTPEAPEVYTRTRISITLAPVEGCEYRCGEDGEWQDSNVFTDLDRSQSYTFYQRIKATNNVSFCSGTSEACTVESYNDVVVSAVTLTAMSVGLSAIAAGRLLAAGGKFLSYNKLWTKVFAFAKRLF